MFEQILRIEWMFFNVEWLLYLWLPRKGQFTGYFASKSYNTALWSMPLLLFGLLPLAFVANKSTNVVATGVFMVLVGFDWWTENDRPKRWRKKIKELAKKFELKPIPRPVIDLG